MPRVTQVAKAQQRYETVPVLDESGQPKRTPVMKNGVQKTTKTGRLVTMAVTVQDKTKPLPPYTCDSCGKPIEVGTPYKHMTPHGSVKRTRHASCPTWQPWEYSNSLASQLARIAYDFTEQVDGAESTDDIQSALDDAAGSVKEIAEQKAEAAQNIEDGFGWETEKSTELREIAESLETWGGEIESADIPEIEDCATCDGEGKVDCVECEGTGEVDNADGTDKTECGECSGGQVECTDCDGSGEDLEGWRDTVRDEVTIVDESPV